MRLVLFALPLVLLACSVPLAPTAPVPTATPEPPVTIEGREGNSRPFTLQGGHYTARWQARSLTNGVCFYVASLRPVTPNERFITSSLGTAQVQSGGLQIGETQIYNVPPGEYYVASSSACGWTITLSPQVAQ